MAANRVVSRQGSLERDQQRGGLVISLDFELGWGVHDSIGSGGGYRQNLLGVRDVVPRMLDLFVEFDVHATWATVGFLFAGSREELEHYSPDAKPSYLDPRRDPYRIEVGKDEKHDPIHFARSLVQQIATAPGQEIASHTFSHYYCLEEGQSIVEFAADLAAARAIAQAQGHTLRSLILPRHQNRSDYLPIIAAEGFKTYRSNEANWLNRPVASGSSGLLVRGARLLDSYVSLSGTNLVSWGETSPDSHSLVDVRESRFLRPINFRLVSLEGLRFNRVANEMRRAARNGALFHLWWHPHNFGSRPNENLAKVRRLLELREELRLEYGFGAFSLADVNHLARQTRSPHGARADATKSGAEKTRRALTASNTDEIKAAL